MLEVLSGTAVAATSVGAAAAAGVPPAQSVVEAVTSLELGKKDLSEKSPTRPLSCKRMRAARRPTTEPETRRPSTRPRRPSCAPRRSRYAGAW